MKNTHTRIFALILLSGLALSGAGCFNSTDNSTHSSEKTMTVPQSTTTEIAASTTNPVLTTGDDSAAKPAAIIKSGAAAAKPKTVIAPKVAVSTVVIKSDSFSPQIIAVKTGDVVIWINKDTIPHTTKSDGSLLWDSGTIQPEKSFSHAFNNPGTYNYSCAIHPSVKGAVIVR
ncbi:MAG: cupredoxin domain-containing protein [Patescibacteria group bacterium]